MLGTTEFSQTTMVAMKKRGAMSNAMWGLASIFMNMGLDGEAVFCEGNGDG